MPRAKKSIRMRLIPSGGSTGEATTGMGNEISRATNRGKSQVKLTVHVSPKLLPGLSLPALLHSVSASLQSVASCPCVTIVLCWDASAESAGITADTDETRLYGTRVVPITEGSCARAPAARNPVLLKVRHARELLGGAALVPENEKTACSVPLLVRERPIGILEFDRIDGSSLTQDDLECLNQIARDVASELESTLRKRECPGFETVSASGETYIEPELETERQIDGIVGRSRALRRALAQAEIVAGTNSTVLICGETGSGKEVIARAIHELSVRRSRPFVKVNCAAIPAGLLESELFGHEKGAFTGAISQRIGRFEVADGGTMFLDEVGEVPLELQPKLLRILQEREFERLGSSQTLRTDARVVAACNRDLASMVDEQQFRADLFYRLNVFPIRVPPLRERTEDIPTLTRHFMQQFATRINRQIDIIPPETMQALVRYSWPGNIRELQNLIERAVILSPGPVLRVPLEDLSSRAARAPQGIEPVTLEDVERAHILATLKETNWVVFGPKGAAARL
ncbi:MAG: sigma 54-interacting transcriptional regulator, partial [Acidobacteriaceae bacterium]|nr:sigma 54-interacting transcriptional regulator [Acidobacteriaceae bacterium]